MAHAPAGVEAREYVRAGQAAQDGPLTLYLKDAAEKDHPAGSTPQQGMSPHTYGKS